MITYILLAFLIGIEILLSINSKYDGFMEKHNTTTARGFAILGIVMHHISQYMEGWNVVTYIFYISGFLFTGIFFLLSGYGNVLSFLKINNSDIKAKIYWLITKILNILEIYILVFVISIIAELITNNFSADDLYRIFTLALPGWINWYIKIQLLLYIIFFIAFSLRLSETLKQIVLVTISVICVFVMSRFLAGYWYNTLICFALGVIVGQNKDIISEIVYKHKYIYLTISIILFAVTFYFHTLQYTKFDIVSAFCFCLLMITATSVFHFYSKPIQLLGTITFEIYLSHLVLIKILLIDKAINMNQNISIVLITLGAIFIGFCIKRIIRFCHALWSQNI